jgi:hypothetical protein
MTYDETYKDEDSWWNDRSLAVKILMGFGFGILAIGFFLLCGFVFMLLWNALMPELFGLGTISYWQGWGVLILSHILFRSGDSSCESGSSKRRKRHIRKVIREEAEQEKQKNQADENVDQEL